jgi:hypothetical protein
MEAQLHTNGNHVDVASKALVVNRNLSVEVTMDEILEDLLYPETRGGAAA